MMICFSFFLSPTKMEKNKERYIYEITTIARSKSEEKKYKNRKEMKKVLFM